MFLVDSITCYCYMMLRKLHYAKWDAKNTAVINSSVVLNCVLNTFLDIFLFFVSSELLQSLYNFPKTRYVLSIFFCMVFLDCRYYIFHKDAICLIGGKINPSIIKSKWLLFIITPSILVGSIAINFLVTQYIGSQGRFSLRECGVAIY